MRAPTFIASLMILVYSGFTILKAQPRCLKRRPNQLMKVVNKEGKDGFINKHGRLVIGFNKWPKNLASVEDFHEGLAAIYLYKPGDTPPTWPYTDQRLAGFIDETGRFAIRPQFDYVESFCKGLALVAQRDQTRFLINHRGEKVIDLTTDCRLTPDDYQRSMRALKTQVDRCNLLIIEGLVGGRTEPFSEGLAAILVYEDRTPLYGFINTEARMVIPPRFEPEREHHGFITAMTRFSDGLAKVKLNGRYGYINKKGKLVIPAEYQRADDFSEGLAHVYSHEKAGYIDRQGRLVIALDENYPGGMIYSSGKFSEGLAAIRFKAGGTGYINRRGKVVISPRFDYAEEFVDGVARVYLSVRQADNYESGYGYINKQGRYIWKPQLRPVAR
jgi:hypothetical protein